MDAIHADEGRLQNMPEEEYNQLLQELDKRIEGIVADVQKTAGSYDMDEIAGLLMENAGQDAMRIQQAFSRQGYDIDGGLEMCIRDRVDTCGKLLDKAELEVVKLMKTADGTPAETEYERDDV